MKIAFDPTKDSKLEVVVGGKPQTYLLRFGMRELLNAEARIKGVKVRADGTGVDEVIKVLTDGSLDSLMAGLSLMLTRHHPNVTNGEIWDICDADLDAVERAVYSVLGKTLPEAEDPKEQPTETAETESVAT